MCITGECRRVFCVYCRFAQNYQTLLFHEVETVTLESTGFYWRPLFILLLDYGFEVFLVNARHVKNAKGHKADVVDSKWLQLIHSEK
ncbi:MAG TPA: hypothetical protein DCY97_04520 [Marinilabiliales bacterium]|nr:hypothetical protein [Marinilabiliales bacterium]